MMRTIAIGLMAGVVLAVAGCFNEVDNSVAKNVNPAYEHVIVHYTLRVGNAIEQSIETGDAMRMLTVMPDMVLLEDYDGNARLIPVPHLLTLRWHPNPEPPEDNQAS